MAITASRTCARDLLERDDLAVLLGVERVHERAVGGVERGRLDLLRVGRVDGPRRVRARAERARDGEQRSRGCGGTGAWASPILPHRSAVVAAPGGSGWTGGRSGGDDVRLMPAAPDLLDDLDQRGLIHDTTDRAALAARLAEGPITLYYGCDPTRAEPPPRQPDRADHAPALPGRRPPPDRAGRRRHRDDRRSRRPLRGAQPARRRDAGRQRGRHQGADQPDPRPRGALDARRQPRRGPPTSACSTSCATSASTSP